MLRSILFTEHEPMPNKAVSAFEALLRSDIYKSVSPTAMTAAVTFEALLKAQTDLYGDETEATPVLQRLGYASGDKDRSFGAMHPHLVHGAQVKLVTLPGSDELTPLHENHREFERHKGTIVKITNPYEPILQIGHRLAQGLASENLTPQDHADLTRHMADPNSKYHPLWWLDAVRKNLDPNSSHIKAARSKHARGASDQRQFARGLLPQGKILQRNQNADTNSVMTFNETIARDTMDGRPDEATRSKQHFGRIVRTTAIVAGANRMLETIRSMGDKFDPKTVNLDDFHVAVTRQPLAKFSQRRWVPGFTPDVVNNSKHITQASGDFGPDGKPTFAPGEYYKNAPKVYEATHGPNASAKLNNPKDIVEAVREMPELDGRTEKGKAARAEGKRILAGYTTGAVRQRLDTYDALLGGSK
jgi:hypothetical protein